MTERKSVSVLLFEAGLVNNQQLTKSMHRSATTGLPAGRIMVLQGYISEVVLSLILEIAVLMRDDSMVIVNDVQELLAPLARKTGAQMDEFALQLLSALYSRRKGGIRIGELLIQAGLLNETDVMNALEVALNSEQMIGQIFVAQGHISEDAMAAAVKFQKQIHDGLLTELEAAALLRSL